MLLLKKELLKILRMELVFLFFYLFTMHTVPQGFSFIVPEKKYIKEQFF